MGYPTDTQALVLVGLFTVAFYGLMYVRRRQWQLEQDRIAEELLATQLDHSSTFGDLVADLS